MRATLSLDLDRYAPTSGPAMADLAETMRLIELWELSSSRQLGREAMARGKAPDPCSVQEIPFEANLRRLVAAFSLSSDLAEKDKAEVLVCALANMLGSIVSTGCSTPAEIDRRAGLIEQRVRLCILDAMEQRGA